MKNDHQCKALVISCIDFRFVTKIRDYLGNQDLIDSYDLITVPGASLNLNTVSESIATSIKLHDPAQIHIFDHEDCGAYGENNSREIHTKNLLKAKESLSNQSPGKSVKTYVVGFNKIEEV